MTRDSNPSTWNVVFIPCVSTLRHHPSGQPLCCSSLRLRLASGLLSANKFASVIRSDIREMMCTFSTRKLLKKTAHPR